MEVITAGSAIRPRSVVLACRWSRSTGPAVIRAPAIPSRDPASHEDVADYAVHDDGSLDPRSLVWRLVVWDILTWVFPNGVVNGRGSSKGPAETRKRGNVALLVVVAGCWLLAQTAPMPLTGVICGVIGAERWRQSPSGCNVIHYATNHLVDRMLLFDASP